MLHLNRKQKNHLTDEELLDFYLKSHDLEIIGILYKRYAHLVYGVCLKYLKDRDDGKDAVMQIFEKIIKELGEKEVKHFKSWIYVVARNYCLMQLRNKKYRESTNIESGDSESFFMESEIEMNHIDETILNTRTDKLKNCLDQLSSEQKRCVELFYLKEKCYKEIVAVTHFELKKVKSYIQNGKRNLKNCMEN